MNSGYSSLPHELFEQVAANAANKSRVIELVVCITTRAQTNGFDSYMNWEFSPKGRREETEEKIFKAYDYILPDLMSRWAGRGFRVQTRHQPLSEPVSFNYGGKTFVWDPGLARFSSQQIAEVMSRP